jgi:hypothetical protein
MTTTPNTTTKPPLDVRLVVDNKDIKRQLIILGISAVATVGMLYMQRALSSPDAFLTLKMRGLASIQTYADSRAKFWNDLSAATAKVYLDSRV